MILTLLLACNPDGGGTHPAAGDDSAQAPDDSATTPDDSASDDSVPPVDSAPVDTGEIAVIGGRAVVRSNSGNPFSAFVRVTMDHDATVVVAYGEGEIDHTTPPVEVLADVATDVLVLGLRAGRKFTLRVDATYNLAHWSSDELPYATAELPTGWPTCTPTFDVDESDFDPDEVLCTQGTMATGRDIYYCTDHWGEPVLEMRTDNEDSLMSMEPLMDGSWVSTSANYGTLLFFDRAGHETKSFTTSSFDGETRFVHEFFDNHEVYQIREGKWLGDVVFITDSYEYFDGGDYKLGQGLIVLDPITDEVVYDYSFHGKLGDQVAMDPLMPYSRPGIGDYAEDWLHANAVLHSNDDDGREYFLISLKAQDWIVKLYPDTDELAWALGFEGAFTLVDDIDAAKPVEQDSYDWAYHQHGMRFVDAEGPRLDLILFDNGYPRHDDTGPNWGLAYSRIVEMELDQETGRAQIDFSYGAVHGPDSFFSSTCGNSILLPDGQRAVAMIGESDTMIEVSYPEGERRWSMSCESSDWCAYQVHWFPSLYETHWIYE